MNARCKIMERNFAGHNRLFYLAAILTFHVGYFGQAPPQAIVSGLVRDEHGAVLPGVTISFERLVSGKNAPVKVKSSDEGAYHVELAPGEYRIKVKFLWFRNFEHKRLTVEAGGTVNFDIELKENPRRTSGIP